MDLSVDSTLLIQLVIFLAGFFVLKALVFGPYLELIHERKKKTVLLKEEAEKTRANATHFKMKYETEIKEEHKKITSWLDGEKKTATEKQREALQKTREQATEKMQAIHLKIKEDVKVAREELLPNIPEYSSMIASRLTGTNIKVMASAGDKSKEGGRQEWLQS